MHEEILKRSKEIFIYVLKDKEAKAVLHGQAVDPIFISDCLNPAGPSLVSPEGILYFPVGPEL